MIFDVAEKEMERADWDAAFTQWQQLLHRISDETHLAYAYQNAIYCLRQQGDLESIGHVLKSISGPALRRSLAAHYWAFDCERAWGGGASAAERRVLLKSGWGPDGDDQRVELFGPSGVGKTTIARRMRQLRDQTNPEFSAVHKILQFLEVKYFVGSCDTFRKFLETLRCQPNVYFQHKYGKEMMRRLALAQFCRSDGDGRIVLEDEGLAQIGINLARACRGHLTTSSSTT